MNQPTQPEALRPIPIALWTANKLEDVVAGGQDFLLFSNTAAELRSQYAEIKRLHKVNQKLAESNAELLGALKALANDKLWVNALAVIAKATNQ